VDVSCSASLLPSSAMSAATSASSSASISAMRWPVSSGLTFQVKTQMLGILNFFPEVLDVAAEAFGGLATGDHERRKAGGKEEEQETLQQCFHRCLGPRSCFPSVGLCPLASQSRTPSTIMRSMTGIGAHVTMAL